MNEGRRPLWDCIEDARDRDHEEEADRNLFAMALLELRRKNTELRHEMASALDEIRLSISSTRDYAKRVGGAVDDLARKIADLDDDVRRLSR